MEDIPVLRVNTLVDENDGSAEEGTGLSLRDAVLIANSTSGDEIIELESDAVYELSIEAVETDLFLNPVDSASVGDLDISGRGGTLTIRGLGEGATINANQIDRVIEVHDNVRDDATNLILDNITVTNGRPITGNVFFSLARNGGGIHINSRATAELINCNITGSSAPKGGGIYNAGTLTMRNCNISNNIAVIGGGVSTYEGNTIISDSTISNNSVNDTSDNETNLSSGGGVEHTGVGTTEITSSNITNNTAGGRGGGVAGSDTIPQRGSVNIIVRDSVISGNTANEGGGVSSGSFGETFVTIENTTIENNVASRNGGGVSVGSPVQEVTITNSIIRSNESQGDGGGIDSEGILTVIGSNISDNTAGGNGGGIDSLSLKSATIRSSIIDSNTAGGNGGGLRDVDVITDTTVANNESTGFGGGMYTISPGIIINSTFNSNETQSSGGGIFVSNIQAPSVVAIANSTVSGNAAKDNGGGIFIYRGRIVNLVDVRSIPGEVFATNVTITGNVSDSDNDGIGEGGGIYNSPSDITNREAYHSGILTLSNSILAENFDTPDNNGEGTIVPNIFGAARGNAHNLTDDLTGLTFETSVASEEESLGRGSDLIDTNPLLGALQNNGGLTPTHALLTGSRAINAGNSDAILQETFIDINNDGEPTSWDFNGDSDYDDAIPYDQRGESSRIADGRVDIGAFELQENESINSPPTVVNVIEDISATENSDSHTIDLSNIFADADGDEITISVQDNSNQELVTPTIEANNLILNFAENQSGTADITIRATANGQTVHETLTVAVGDVGEELGLVQTIDLFRFRNTSFDTGTYVFVGEQEKNDILADENLSNTFSLDGEQEDGTVIPAFTASTTPGDGLIAFYRLKSLDVEGTFLFVAQQEYDGIFAEDSEQRDKWEPEGLNEAGEDIPEFYLYDGSADTGTQFNRFQNTQNGTFLYAGEAETEAIESDDNLSNLFTNQGVAFKSLS